LSSEQEDTTRRDVRVLASGASLSIIGKALGKVFSLLGDILLARVLGAGLYGLYAIGWTVYRVISVVSPLGLPQGVIRYLPVYRGNKDPRQEKGLFFLSIFLSLLAGVVFGFILFLCAPLISTAFFHKPGLLSVFQLFSLSVPLVSVFTIITAITRSTQRMKYSVLLEDIGQPLLGLVFLVIVALTFINKLSGAILSNFVSFCISLVAGLLIVVRLFRNVFIPSVKPDYSVTREVILYSIPTSLAGIFSVYVFWIDRLIVGILLSASLNGIYQVASQVSMLFVIIYAAFNAILTPMFSHLFSGREHARLEEIYRVGTKWCFYLSIVPFIILLLYSSEIITFVFGSEYSNGYIALVILSLGQVINCATGSIGALLMMTGNQKLWFRLTVGSFLLNALFCLILIPKFGLVGAAAGTALSVGGMNILAVTLGKWKLDLWPYDRRYLKGLVSGSIAVLSGYFLRILMVPSIQTVLFSSLVILIIFLGSLVLFKFDSEDKMFISMVIQKIGRRA
jgi:O-antigen/teichoic acid export membrane protein